MAGSFWSGSFSQAGGHLLHQIGDAPAELVDSAVLGRDRISIALMRYIQQALPEAQRGEPDRESGGDRDAKAPPGEPERAGQRQGDRNSDDDARDPLDRAAQGLVEAHLYDQGCR